MPLSDKIQQLEEQIRHRIEQTFGEMRQEILDRFRTQSEGLREQLEKLSAGLPETLFEDSDLQPVLEEVSQEVRQQEAQKATGASAAELREALAALDTARSQGDLLQALLEQCGRFASRVAVFLAQPGKLQGWGGHGFGDGEATLREMVVDAPEGSGWARLLAGQGVVELGSAERATLASRLEAPVGRRAVLLPLLLRDRVAGAVYADRVGEASLPVDSLQTLTYVAALAIETLPMRQRESTPTLVAFASPGPAPLAPPTEAPFPETAPPAEEPVAEEPMAEAPVAEETPPGRPAPPIPPAAEAVELEVLQDIEVSPSSMDEVELDDMDLGEVDLKAEEEVPLEGFEAEPGRESQPETAVPPPEDTSLSPAPSYATPDYGGPAAEGAPPTEGLTTGPETAAVGEMLEREPERPGWTLEESPAEEAEVEEAAPEAPSTPVEAQPPTPTAVPPPETPRAPAAGAEDTHPGPGGVEVAPPSDVQGPGWAFAGTEEMDGDEEARHEEARRLARLLVSEIKLYNEEHVMEGRQHNDIFERLKDDIERSRQLYDARVDERVREKTDYFYQEMVRVLGAGDPKTLGI